MKVWKLMLTITLLFTTTLSSQAPLLTYERMKEMLILRQIVLDRQRREREMKEFLEAVAYSESRGNPKAYNKYGYIGKYQFGYGTRKSTGFGYISYSNFVRNPSIWSEADQDTAMIRLLSKNERHLRDIIHKYNGYILRGDTITKSGILAAAHLAGAGGVKKYFTNGYNPKDAYGTGLEDYLIRFSGFNF